MTFNFLFTRRFQQYVIRQGLVNTGPGLQLHTTTNPTMIAAGGNGPLVEAMVAMVVLPLRGHVTNIFYSYVDLHT